MRPLLAARSRRLVHLLWAATLVLCLALPIYSLLDFGVSASPGRFTGAATTMANASDVPALTQGNRAAWLTSFFQKHAAPAPLKRFFARTFLTLLLSCYGLFLCYRVCALWLARRRTGRLARAATARPLTAQMNEAAARCLEACELGKMPLILCSLQATVPLTMRVRRPIIVLPEALFRETSAEMLAAALGHEMAHIRRRDYFFNLAYEVLYLPVSFHPAARLARRRINTTRELACDELVTQRILAPVTYARSLVQLAQSLTLVKRPALALGVFDADILEERIMRLIENEKRADARFGKLLPFVAAVALCLTSVAATTFSVNAERIKSALGITAPSAIVGTWQGTWHGDVPALTLTVRNDADKLSGALVFYRAAQTESGLKVDGQTDELPLVNPSFDSRTLTFQLIVKGATTRYEMTLTGNNEAEFRNLAAKVDDTSLVKCRRTNIVNSFAAEAPKANATVNSAGQADASVLAGTWFVVFAANGGKDAPEADAPSITLKLKADGDRLSGTAMTWKETEPKQGWQKVEWPLIEPKFDGRAFSFKVNNGEEFLIGELQLAGDKFEGQWKSSKSNQSGRMKLIRKA